MWEFDHLAMPEAVLRFSAGETIISEGEVGEVMYAVLEGVVEITVHGRRVDWLEKGAFFGEMALVDEGPRSASAKAVTDCRLLVIDHARFGNLVRQNPNFALYVMSVMSIRTRHLMEEEVQRQRMEEELAIGRRIQLSLLPEKPPEIPGWKIAAFYRPAREVGGDLYDFVVSPAESQVLNIVIADVTGKGVPAALFMAVSRTFMRTEIMNGHNPAGLLQLTNQFLLRERASQLFLSAFVARLDTETGVVTFANGGHETPLLIRADTGNISSLDATGFLLGAFDDFRTTENSAILHPGDALVFYTDGVTEARNSTGKLLENSGLHKIIQSGYWRHADDILQMIVAGVDAFAGPVSQNDDITMVVVHRSPMINE